MPCRLGSSGANNDVAVMNASFRLMQGRPVRPGRETLSMIAWRATPGQTEAELAAEMKKSTIGAFFVAEGDAASPARKSIQRIKTCAGRH
jgi:hypothetical protein